MRKISILWVLVGVAILVWFLTFSGSEQQVEQPVVVNSPQVVESEAEQIVEVDEEEAVVALPLEKPAVTYNHRSARVVATGLPRGHLTHKPFDDEVAQAATQRPCTRSLRYRFFKWRGRRLQN